MLQLTCSLTGPQALPHRVTGRGLHICVLQQLVVHLPHRVQLTLHSCLGALVVDSLHTSLQGLLICSGPAVSRTLFSLHL